MINTEIADLLLQGILNNFQECSRVSTGVAVKFNVGDCSGIAQIMEGSLKLDLDGCGNGIIHRNME
ncbi:hypothetical protein D3C85_1271030 [compost metagenome]